MKRLCLLLVCVVMLLCVGCTKQWSDEKAHIYRDDIEPSDFAFLFDEWEYEVGMTEKEVALGFLNAFRKDTIKPEDIFDALGLPFSTMEDYGVISYTYVFGEEFDGVTIKYNPEKDEIEFHPDIRSIEDMNDAGDILVFWSSGDSSIDSEKYKMRKRFDISEKELSFIDENTTSKDVQQSFGAPHYYIESRKTSVETTSGNAFVYTLENGTVFKIIYFRQGYIFRAWFEEIDGDQIRLLIDRNTTNFYKD